MMNISPRSFSHALRRYGIVIRFDGGPENIGEHVLELGRSCHNLVHLHLESGPPSQYQTAYYAITDDQVGQLASSMPQLEYLCCRFSHRLSFKAWVLVGSQCRQLRGSVIRGRCPLAVELRDQDGIDCLYSQLRLLEFEWADIHHNAISPEEYAERIRHHAPCLESITMICGMETEMEHMDIWRSCGLFALKLKEPL